jgi:hypothetical protein
LQDVNRLSVFLSPLSQEEILFLNGALGDAKQLRDLAEHFLSPLARC